MTELTILEALAQYKDRVVEEEDAKRTREQAYSTYEVMINRQREAMARADAAQGTLLAAIHLVVQREIRQGKLQ